MNGSAQVQGFDLSKFNIEHLKPSPETNEVKNRVDIQIHKDDKCPICHETFIDAEKKELKFSVLKSDKMGIVHDKCFLPYHCEDNVTILVKIRCWSLGDSISITPIFRELKRIYPRAKLSVLTFYSDVFINNPHIETILDLNHPVLKSVLASYTFTLDAFQTETRHHFAMHSVEFASQCALNRSLLPNAWEYELYYSDENRIYAKKLLRENGIDIHKDKVIVLHPHGTEWETRNWGEYGMNNLAAKLKETLKEFKFVSVGGKRDHIKDHAMKNYVAFKEELGVIDLYGKMSILETAAMLDLPCIKLMVTPDTGTLHLAATRPNLPIVGIFTLIKAFYRTPVRQGRFSHNFIGINADDPCNCTVDVRFLTNETFLGTCPKKAFLEKTLKMNAPDIIIKDGLQNYDNKREWKTENLSEQIDDELLKFTAQPLPCFPMVDKVFNACIKLLKQNGSI